MINEKGAIFIVTVEVSVQTVIVWIIFYNFQKESNFCIKEDVNKILSV